MMVPIQAVRTPLFVLILFALTIFCSAFLLFQIQPMISKYILPWFGGSPAVWTTAMLFFQCLLFAGYVYAHVLTRLSSRRLQSIIHIALIFSGALLAANILPQAQWKPSGEELPALQVLIILAVSIGAPYFCLATTGPLLQHWFSHTSAAKSVYRLYAVSNIGSFAALISFPYLFEPFFNLDQISRWWSLGFYVFFLMCIPLAMGLGQSVTPMMNTNNRTINIEVQAEITVFKRLGWIFLPALASLVFIATTDQVSHNIAPEPSLWITTLGIYLLTFILTFDHPRWYRPVPTVFFLLIVLCVTAGRDVIPNWLNFEWDYGVSELRIMHYVLLFFVCLLCHGELYRRRPRDVRYLTEFYICMSLGGACGGIFVTLFATYLFNDYYEWPMAILGTVILCFSVLLRDLTWFQLALRQWRSSSKLAGSVTKKLGVVLFFMVVFSFIVFNSFRKNSNAPLDQVVVNLDQSRNFYGTITVQDLKHPEQPELDHRVFLSGQIKHGIQFQSQNLRYQPATYYGPESGVGETFSYLHRSDKPLHVGLIGLGAGTLANYAREQDRFDYFEINPDAVRVAQTWFDNLAASKSKEMHITLGDARIQFERLHESVKYDVIVLDAFTGGSVPIHLLTQEAFAIYKKHLKHNGFIVINITNAYLNLFPVVKAQTAALGLGYRYKFQDLDEARLVKRNQYFIATEDKFYLKEFKSVHRTIVSDSGQKIVEEDRDRPNIRLWTDQYSSIYQILW